MKKLYILLLFIAFALPGLGQEKSDTRNIYIFFSNDVHGGIAEQDAEFLNPDFPPRLAGGSAVYRMVESYREMARKDDDIVLLLDAGDIFQGTPIGSKTDGRAVIEYMNYVGYDAVIAGNHDFDNGRENIASLGNLN